MSSGLKGLWGLSRKRVFDLLELDMVKRQADKAFQGHVYRGFKWCNNETRDLKGNISLILGDKVKPQDLK